MEKFLIQPVTAVVVSSLMATRAYRRKSLDFSGAIAGAIVMTVHLAAGARFGFFISHPLILGEFISSRIRNNSR